MPGGNCDLFILSRAGWAGFDNKSDEQDKLPAIGWLFIDTSKHVSCFNSSECAAVN